MIRLGKKREDKLLSRRLFIILIRTVLYLVDEIMESLEVDMTTLRDKKIFESLDCSKSSTRSTGS